jgi:membrane-associated protease RseP (regulator of RpoE activity)
MEDYSSTPSGIGTLETIAGLRSALGQVMQIDSHLIHSKPVELIEFTGRLTAPSDEAFDHIYARFMNLGYTPMLTERDGQHLVVAQHGVVVPTPNTISTNIALFILTVVSTWLVGVLYGGGTALARLVPAGTTDPFAVYGIILSHPEVWLSGVPYVLALLGILGVHEMGHYVAARIHKAAVTLPYFIPIPIGLGTMGAVIRLKSPIKNRRQLFDIGVAGPLAGMAIALPLLIVGLATSPIQYVGTPVPGSQEGNSILYLLLKLITKGQILPSGGYDIILNSIAFPAWFGFMVTMINLLPIGQLDGGHVLYSLFGRRQWRVASVTIFGLIGLGAYLAIATGDLINVWFVWAFLAQIFGLRHPPPLDDLTPLDRRRKLIGYATIVLFVLIFTPLPFS